MGIERRLERWTRAGLLEPDQAARIREFERHTRRPLFSHALATVGGLAIAIGSVSIVASNWDAIAGSVKLGLDLLLVALLGGLVLHWDRRGPFWLRETGMGVLYALVLASIALVGQVYQLGGQTYAALSTWTVLTAVLMAQARSRVLALVWLAGMQITWGFVLDHASELGEQAKGWALAAIYWVPLVMLGLGRARWLEARRPQLSQLLRELGWAQLVVLASLATFIFYDARGSYAWPLSLWLGAGVSLAMSSWLCVNVPAGDARNPARCLILASFLLCHAAWHLPFEHLPLLSALLFLALWLLVAFVVHRAGLIRWLNLATAVLGVRLVSVYFEVFGSLLDTGLGLVFGGMLTLALVWLWQRKRRQFELAAKGKAT